MPFALIIIGALLIASGLKDTQGELGTLLSNDLIGAGSFAWWFVSILIVGAVGYIPQVKPVSQAMLALIVSGLIFTNARHGLFSQFTQAIGQFKSPGPGQTVDLSGQGIPVEGVKQQQQGMGAGGSQQASLGGSSDQAPPVDIAINLGSSVSNSFGSLGQFAGLAAMFA